MKKSISRSFPSCIICNSDDTYVWHKGNADPKKISFTYEFSPQAKKTLRVIRCRKCSHVFCHPLPPEIFKNYIDVVDEKYLTQEDDRKTTAQKLILEIKKYKKKGKILDVGCATGDFLEIARKNGYEVEGVELSKWSGRIAAKKGIVIHKITLEHLAKEFQNKYDIVTLWGVIEHFEYPVDEMKFINKILKKNGFVFIWTGDVDSITSRIMGRNWWYWLGQHIQYFTRRSLRLSGELAGFEQIFSKIYPQVVTYHKVQNSMSRYDNKTLMYLFGVLFSFKKNWFVKIPGEIFWMGKKIEEIGNNYNDKTKKT